jgi:hypothetical protein
MSEYQYYEFLAIDRPLTSKQMEELGNYSTRADITPTSFVNEYHWGNFRGSVDDFLTRFFDAHVYYANWGTRTFALRLPADAVDLKAVDPYRTQQVITITGKGKNLIFEFNSQIEDDWDDEEGGGWMASLVANRAELMGGDLRCLYLAWLRAAQEGEVEEEETEPPVPDGMGDLSTSQQSLADFLRVDPDLIEIAARESRPMPANEGTSEFAAWVKALPQAEKDELLLSFSSGSDPHLAGKLQRRFRALHKPAGAQANKRRRTAAEMLAEVARIDAERARIKAERDERERLRQQAEALKARAAHLAKLAQRQDAAWKEVEGLVASKQAKKYDEAITLLKDLRVVSDQTGETPAFSRRLGGLLDRHSQKSSFCKKVAQERIAPNPANAC